MKKKTLHFYLPFLLILLLSIFLFLQKRDNIETIGDLIPQDRDFSSINVVYSKVYNNEPIPGVFFTIDASQMAQLLQLFQITPIKFGGSNAHGVIGGPGVDCIYNITIMHKSGEPPYQLSLTSNGTVYQVSNYYYMTADRDEFFSAFLSILNTWDTA